ncbi:unnamed protein product [Brassicogethes aeneus]|uniref:von Hippel-Lindau disease tumour suppressor beta domain-containing protein n=1 Tax=Brassicogethes aeneus TaxID=1431903 RepID=A0A9P0B002_BRAAE|nr:unnamed protein product [Brassicogethes aeneus]
MNNELRSLRNEERAFVRFINATERTVRIVWVGFSGQYVTYNYLAKGNYIDINTYKQHPWIALDTSTEDRLLIDRKYVYFPRTTKEYFEERMPGKALPPNFETRIKVYVTLPLYSLRYRALMELRNHFDTTEGIEDLELPRQLTEDLKKLITQRNNQKNDCNTPPEQPL